MKQNIYIMNKTGEIIGIIKNDILDSIWIKLGD